MLDDGRVVQLGGELIGAFHTAYLGLAAELGLETEPSYVAEPGELSWDLAEGAGRGEWPPFFDAADAADAERVEAECVALAATVDPADPWSHPDAAALDSVSLAAWLRSVGARPAVLRLFELGSLSLAGGSIARLSLLGAAAHDGRRGRAGVLRLRALGGTAADDRQRVAGAADGGRARRRGCGSARRSSRSKSARVAAA